MAVALLDRLRELMLHMEWADATMWRALLAHPPALKDARVRVWFGRPAPDWSAVASFAPTAQR